MVFTPDLKTSLRSGQSSHRPEVAASGHTDLAEVTGPDGDLTINVYPRNPLMKLFLFNKMISQTVLL